MTYGVVERKGFIVLTGEVGTGKTTMVQALLASLDKNVEVVYISNPMLSDKDFIDYLAFSAFKKRVHFKSKADFLVEFEEFLKDCLRNQRIFLLIVDEAQRLSFSLLEEIRLLSNMETADEKLINIFLIGQPELNDKLSEPRCRALLQRVSVRHHIRPLDLNETREYLMTRLKIAGARNGDKIFPRSTVKAIHQYSEGYPRMINILADNALLLGYSRGKKKISPEMIRECYEDIRPKHEASKLQVKGSSAVTRVMVQDKSRKSRRVWKWAVVVLALLAVAAVAALQRDTVTKAVEKIFPSLSRMLIPAPKQAKMPEKVQITVEHSKPATQKEVKTGSVTPKEPGGVTETPKTASSLSESPSDEQGRAEQSGPPEVPKTETAPLQEDLSSWPTRVVKPGDTLAQLAMEVYGYADQKVLKLIQEHNPEIIDINLINVGQRIVFPPVSAKQTGPTYTVYVASYTPFAAARQEFQRLSAEGYEVYILPASDPEKGKVYRITLGNFNKLEYAQEYASMLMEKGVTPHAKPIRLEVR